MYCLKRFVTAFGIASVLASPSVFAQNIFTYGSIPVSKSEFLRVYTKNSIQKAPDYSEKALKEYLDLYALFKMKVKEAEAMKLDTSAAIKAELSGYKNQLAKSYMSDKNTLEELSKVAYERLKEDVNVSHILVSVRANEDTLAPYKKIDSIYQVLAKNAAAWDQLVNLSDDKGSIPGKGNIGYITALQVVYPFENAIYTTPVGQISKPFRTQFGYHIAKVIDKRKSRGEVQIQQILIQVPKSRGEAGETEAQEKITKIKDALKKGSSFEALVKEYSEDKFTKNKDGMMDPFGVGKVDPKIEDAAFALAKPGSVSEPIRTEYGYHILKLVKKIPLGTYAEAKDNLLRRVEHDSRNTIAKELKQEEFKKSIGFKEHPANLTALINAIPEDSLKDRGFDANEYKQYTAPLFEIKNKKYTQHDFITYAAGLTRGRVFGSKNNTFGDLYKVYLNNIITDYQIEHLESTNADFKNLMTEYRDGVLLFDLMDQKVWSKASKDTIGLQNFYQSNKAKYVWKPSFEGTVFQSSSEVGLNRLQALIKAGVEPTTALDSLVKDQKNPVSISSQKGRFEMHRFALEPNKFVANQPSSVFKNPDGTYNLLSISNVYTTESPKTLEEARGYVIADYQEYLETQWHTELKQKYPIKVDEKTFKSVVKK